MDVDVALAVGDCSAAGVASGSMVHELRAELAARLYNVRAEGRAQGGHGGIGRLRAVRLGRQLWEAEGGWRGVVEGRKQRAAPPPNPPPAPVPRARPARTS